MLAMARTPVKLTGRLGIQELLRTQASTEDRGLSNSESVGNGVDLLQTRMEQGAHTSTARRAIAAAGRFHNGRGEVTRRPDEFLVSAYESSRG